MGMLHFDMNAGNFGSYLGGGSGEGVRLGSSGVVLDWQRHEADEHTLGLWHLSGGTWADASGHGLTLTPSSDPELHEDGAYFDGTSCAYCTLDLRGHDALTVEAWVRPGAIPSGNTYFLAQYYNVRLHINTEGKLTGSLSGVSSGGGTVYLVAPTAATVGEWYHLAMTFARNAVGGAKLWINGVVVVTANTGDYATGGTENTRLDIGALNNSYRLTGWVDEVRVSDVVRYTSAFSARRVMSAGAFESPAFDAARQGAAWTAMEHEGTTPAGSSLVMLARAGDALDGDGGVDAGWTLPLGGLPSGRYMQWRAVLLPAAGGSGWPSPVLSSVATTASEAGYNVYHGVGATAGTALDYAAPAARVGPGRLSHAAAGLAYPAVHWFGVRSVDGAGREAATVSAEVRLELDAAGERVALRPASVTALEAEGAGGGRVRLTWQAVAEGGEATTEVFRIYCGVGSVEFGAAVGEVRCEAGRREYQWTSTALAHGAAMVFAVRSETSAGGCDADPPQVAVVVDASGPAAAGMVRAEAWLGEA